MGFDVSQRKDTSNEGEWLELEHEDGSPMDARIKLLGYDSDVCQKQRRKNADKRLKKRNFKTTSAELENENISLMVAATQDWEGFEDGGTALECTQENVRWLYQNCPEVRDQVDAFMGDRSNFLHR